MKIPVIFSFARSGGTLVNQLLGVHPDCLILSEVSPAGALASVLKQGSEWLGLVEPEEFENFNELSYSQQISLLDARAKSTGKVLIIRDWVSANYLGNVGHTVFPSSALEQEAYLARAGYTLQPLVITRKAIDVYHSLRRSFKQFASLSEEDFLSSYLVYAHAVSAFPRVSLESLQSAPYETLKDILHSFSLSSDYIDMQLRTFADFKRCTGNNTLGVPAATSNLRNIAPITIDYLTDNACINQAAFADADRLLGYVV